MTVIALAPYLFAAPFSRPVRTAVARSWYRGCSWLCGLKVRVRGHSVGAGPVLYTVNHVSYLDVVVLGGLLDAVFVAKAEVARWPVIGPLARLQRTIFTERTATRASVEHTELRRRLAMGGSVIIFPEGTSSDGRRVLPFKSAVFDIVKPRRLGRDIWIQPVSVAYPRYADGRPLTGGLEACYAWYGDANLFGHLVRVFGLRGAAVEVTFHEPVRASAFADRKALARHCEARVAVGVRAAFIRTLACTPRLRPDPKNGRPGP
jgi:1-acyl-sn-glycerol-3-phosphate acyltransferase